MEKLFKPFKDKFNVKKKNNKIFKQLPEEDNRKIIFHPFKKHIKGTLALLSATTLVIGGSFSMSYLESHENNVFATDSYTIIIDGEEFGKIRDPETFESTIKKIEKDIEKLVDLDIAIENNFEIVASKAKDKQIISEDELYNALKPEVDYTLLGYSIIINGQKIGVVESEYKAKNVIEEVKNYFADNYDEESLIEVSTVENIEIKQIKVSNSEIKKEDDIINYIIKGTDEEQKYIVEEGDNYWDIANHFNMSLDELISANPSANPELIQIGDELNLVVPKPFINVQVKRKVVQEEKTPYETTFEYVSYLYNDEEVVSKAGKYGVSKIEAIVTEQNGIEVAKDVLSKVVISEPTNKVVVTGTQDPPPKQGSGYFINPLPGSLISSRFGSRSGGFHMGQDMAKSSGSSIKAADGGTVVFAGWSGSYGYLVEIDHGGGYTTRYAHNSAIYVSRGEKVYQGKVISSVGSTGVSTGPRLHFEVRKYGSPVNPASYIGIQYR